LQFEETGRRREKIANSIAGMISSLVLIRQHRGHSQSSGAHGKIRAEQKSDSPTEYWSLGGKKRTRQ
jgi:hypothetical protein